MFLIEVRVLEMDIIEMSNLIREIFTKNISFLADFRLDFCIILTAVCKIPVLK
jgi:hypothetical protein